MENMRKQIVKKIILYMLVVAQMVFIYCNSAESADDSNETSGFFSRIVASVMTPGFEELSEEEQAIVVEQYQFYVRKVAHVVEYAVLSFLIMLAIDARTRWLHGILIALPVTSAYSALDEIHQLLVDGRSCELRDLFIDSGGGVLGFIGAIFVFWLIDRIKERKCSKKA